MASRMCRSGDTAGGVLNLETGEMVELMTDTDGILPYMYGVWEDIAVYQTVKTVEGAPELEDWLAQQPGGHNVVSVRPAILQISRLFQKSQNRRRKNDRRRVGKFRMDGGPTHELGTVRRVSD